MTEQKPNNNQQLYYAGIAVVVVVVLIAVWFLLAKDDTPQPVTLLPPELTEPQTPVTTPESDSTAQPQAEPEPVTEPEQSATETLPEAEPEAPLPTLDQSDSEVKQRLLALDWRAGLAGLFVTEDMLRNFVVQVDNIAQGQLAAEHALLQPLEQKFSPSDAEKLQLDEQSFRRYQPYIQLLESVPPEQMLHLFNRYEPLLQQAYAELGYPDELFKNKVIAAIDHLLATPEVSYPLQLERPAVVYTFADPALEQLPAAQKQMIRLGPDNQNKIKALLQRYRSALLATP